MIKFTGCPFGKIFGVLPPNLTYHTGFLPGDVKVVNMDYGEPGENNNLCIE